METMTASPSEPRRTTRTAPPTERRRTTGDARIEPTCECPEFCLLDHSN